ncbi:L,D-transpeptidase family protein [Ectobacillus sp. sgz5001026]|uniref:L,D-transpeptidase n=1 Tax=Ectobacillus sp. sgz5001026 TaxID=3242473 RepID=UPI0036D2E2E4
MRILLLSLYILTIIISNVQGAGQGDRFIVINLANNQLSYFENGMYMKSFPVSTGTSETPTPEGRFFIIDKYKNKDYHRKQIEGGAPNNPLGTRWMGLNYKQYGIHGTNKEYSIGSRESNGCIRMNDRNIQWLYERTPLQTSVVIATFDESVERAAHKFGYQVISWNKEQVHPKQIGQIRTLDTTMLYWQDFHGHFIPIREIKANQKFPVFSRHYKDMFNVGNRTYIRDSTKAISYEQIPEYIIVNQYKRNIKH